MAVKVTLFEYWQQKELEWGRRITVAEVVRGAKVSRNAVQNLLDGNSTRYDQPVIDAICRYFRAPAGPVPFIVYEPEKNEEEDT